MTFSHPALWIPEWPVPSGVRACVTLRGDAGVSPPPFDRFNLGAHGGDDPSHVTANRAQLRAIAGLPAEPRWLQQVHGTAVVRLSSTKDPADIQREGPQADAAVTGDRGVVLAVLSADCLPVLFCSDDGDRLAAAHAGWRGLAAGVLEATLDAMEVPAEQLVAWLGPAAGPQAYEVGDEVREAFLAVDPGSAEAFRPTRVGHWLCDLYQIARLRLAARGVLRVFGGKACTISQPDLFFSHRRDGRTGRMASLIWRED